MTATGMIEFDEHLNRTVNKEALINRLKARLNISLGSIAYYPYGTADKTFDLTSTGAEIKSAVRDIVPDAKVAVAPGRVSITTVEVQLTLEV